MTRVKWLGKVTEGKDGSMYRGDTPEAMNALRAGVRPRLRKSARKPSSETRIVVGLEGVGAVPVGRDRRCRLCLGSVDCAIRDKDAEEDNGHANDCHTPSSRRVSFHLPLLDLVKLI